MYSIANIGWILSDKLALSVSYTIILPMYPIAHFAVIAWAKMYLYVR